MPATTRLPFSLPWRAAALVAVSGVPIFAGLRRLFILSGGAEMTAEHARFFAVPVPAIVHVAGALAFVTLGALQVTGGVRGDAHRRRGRGLVAAGWVTVLSGLWMLAVYPAPPDGGVALTASRLTLAALLALSLTLGIRAIRRGDRSGHRAWMIRAYAAMATPGTQLLLYLPLAAAAGAPGAVGHGRVLAAALALNLAAAEAAIRRSRVTGLAG